MEFLGEGLKKIILAGIGTAAATAEKSKEILDEMVKKGELTVEQGKVLNQELKHNIKKTVRESVGAAQPSTEEEMDEMLNKLTPDQLAQLKERIANFQEKKEDVQEEADAAAETADEVNEEAITEEREEDTPEEE